MFRYKLLEYVDRNGKSPFRVWLNSFSVQIKARIQARLFRFENGNLGDYKSLGHGLFEARFDFGAGYRIYFGIYEKELILLLLGGNKGSQIRDIKKASLLWLDFIKDRNNDKTKS